jgi:hypothetical protein
VGVHVRVVPIFARSRQGLVLGVTLAACAEPGAAGEPRGSAGSAGAAGAAGSVTASAGAAGAAGAPSASGGTSAGAGAAAGAPSSAGSVMGGAPAAVPVFVAQGHHGRVTRSCDDGRTFPFNHSRDDAFRCFSDAEHDCDHSEVAGRGLAFGQGSFVATWGWGHPGTLQRSTDGEAWPDVMLDTPTFADVAFGNSLFVAGGNPTHVSKDGVTWEMGGKLSFDFNYRGIEFVPAGGGTFVVAGESGEQRGISISHDGKIWRAALERPAPCGQELRGIAGSDSVIVLASAQGHVCRSVDGGNVWTHHAVTERFTSPPLWTGTEFWLYSGAARWKSVDGVEWTSQAIEPGSISIGPLARSSSGTLVAANDGWQVWYEKQQFFRSTDGVHWQALPASAFTGSHPITFVSFGYVAPSAGCGLP